jgi:divalent metal cation (Fe/Co/Zn/Cd) transporter
MRNRDIEEIGRILVSLVLLLMAGFLFWNSLKCLDVGTAKGMGDLGSSIITLVGYYWLAPTKEYHPRKGKGK